MYHHLIFEMKMDGIWRLDEEMGSSLLPEILPGVITANTTNQMNVL